MAKHTAAAVGWGHHHLQKRWLLPLPLMLSVSTVIAFFIRDAFDSCNRNVSGAVSVYNVSGSARNAIQVTEKRASQIAAAKPSPLSFMKSKIVLLVLHELSLSGGPLLLMELAFLSSSVGAEVYWITIMKPSETDEVIYSLEHKMLDRGVQQNTGRIGLERLKTKMPKTYIVHLGNSKELMQVAEDSVAKRVLHEHVRESLGVRNEDLLFALINSVSRGKGQDLFLRSFYEALQLIKEKKMQVPPLHAVIVGSDMSAQTKFEMELRDYVMQKKIQDHDHFVNKTLTVAPYLAAIDVLVQNSQGTAAGGTKEIVVNGTTGILHPIGKEGVTPLAENIVLNWLLMLRGGLPWEKEGMKGSKKDF